MKKKIIVANWKMNNGFDEADQWFLGLLQKHETEKNVLQNVDAVVCPCVILIDSMAANLADYSFDSVEKNVALQNKAIEEFKEEELTKMVLAQKPLSIGAQDCHYESFGAFTGDVSAKMIAEVGCEYVILGHSERRQNHVESSEFVAKKVSAVVAQKLIPILCVGESKEVRDAGSHLEFVYKQLMESVPKVEKFKKFVIAYEPIWSIGTGVVPSVAQIKEMMNLIHKVAREKLSHLADEFFVLYGGSVSVDNSGEILAISNLDGLLIGKVSLNVDDFFDICKKASVATSVSV